ncbi:MAG: MATE family multidrug resistance protein [Myxococcota bacterium]|jgi:MATE family multidrug resistance protein
MTAHRRRHHRSLARVWHLRVFTLAWPILVSMFSYSAMTVADTLFVSWLGTAALAAIGLAATLGLLATAFGNGLLGGVRVTVAQAVGARDEALARTLGWQGIWLALALGLPVALLARHGAPLFGWMGASPEVSTLAASYFTWRTLAAPAVFANTALGGWFQARGDTRTPMVAAVLGNVVNIALDPVLIFGLGPVAPMGIEGAAIATVTSQAVMLSVLVVPAARDLLRRISLPERAAVRSIVRVGLPTGIQYTLDIASFTAFCALLARSGDAHLAAHVIAVRIIMLSFLPGLAIGQAAGVLVGQAVGARRPERARRAFRTGAEQATVVMGLLGLAFIVFPDALVGVFGAAPEVAVLASQVLLVAAAIQLSDAIATTALCSLTGAGDTRFVLAISVGASWLVKLPIAAALVLGTDLGVVGAWLGVAAEITALAVVATARIRGAAWLRDGEPLAAASAVATP